MRLLRRALQTKGRRGETARQTSPISYDPFRQYRGSNKCEVHQNILTNCLNLMIVERGSTHLNTSSQPSPMGNFNIIFFQIVSENIIYSFNMLFIRYSVLQELIFVRLNFANFAILGSSATLNSHEMQKIRPSAKLNFRKV